MSAIIEATGRSMDAGPRGSIAHAVAAARDCIAAAGVAPAEIDILINVGVHRDQNMAEPAMSALIQKELGISLDYAKQGFHPAFSFDLMNGACGVLNAVQVASSLLAIGKARRALIVASDAHPGGIDDDAFPYATVGGAMLLGRSDRAGVGFGRVHVHAASDAASGSESFVQFGQAVANGRQRITVRREPDYVDKLLDVAARAARECAELERLALKEVLLVTSQPAPDFGRALARRLGLDDTAALPPLHLERDPHTSSLPLAYHMAFPAGETRAPRVLLFVAAGAGLTAAAATYRS
jgi:3-oxoacyl-[acyl-carrier-protein] synthase III